MLSPFLFFPPPPCPFPLSIDLPWNCLAWCGAAAADTNIGAVTLVIITRAAAGATATGGTVTLPPPAATATPRGLHLLAPAIIYRVDLHCFESHRFLARGLCLPGLPRGTGLWPANQTVPHFLLPDCRIPQTHTDILVGKEFLHLVGGTLYAQIAPSQLLWG